VWLNALHKCIVHNVHDPCDKGAKAACAAAHQNTCAKGSAMCSGGCLTDYQLATSGECQLIPKNTDPCTQAVRVSCSAANRKACSTGKNSSACGECVHGYEAVVSTDGQAEQMCHDKTPEHLEVCTKEVLANCKSLQRQPCTTGSAVCGDCLPSTVAASHDGWSRCVVRATDDPCTAKQIASCTALSRKKCLSGTKHCGDCIAGYTKALDTANKRDKDEGLMSKAKHELKENGKNSSPCELVIPDDKCTDAAADLCVAAFKSPCMQHTLQQRVSADFDGGDAACGATCISGYELTEGGECMKSKKPKVTSASAPPRKAVPIGSAHPNPCLSGHVTDENDQDPACVTLHRLTCVEGGHCGACVATHKAIQEPVGLTSKCVDRKTLPGPSSPSGPGGGIVMAAIAAAVAVFAGVGVLYYRRWKRNHMDVSNLKNYLSSVPDVGGPDTSSSVYI
jgi:hypothetical protein